MEAVKNCKTYLPSNQQFGDKVHKHRSTNFDTKRKIDDSVTRGYLTEEQWLRIMNWLDNVDSTYFPEETESRDAREHDDMSNETESSTERRPKYTKKDARSHTRRRSDVKDPHRRENHSGEKKKHLSWHPNITYYRGSCFRDLRHNKICVDGLQRNLTTADVAKLFESFGKIAFIDHQISVGYDGRKRAYVVFVSHYSVQEAVKVMDGIKVRDCRITVTAM